MRLQRILVPVDFSAQSEQAAIIAVELANRHMAAVTVLHVDPFPGAAAIAVEPVYIPPDLFAGLRADYNRRIDEDMARLEATLRAYKAPAVPLALERRTAIVTDGIIEYASEWDADLIVMGSSGLTGAARLLLGSVADKVSRQAPCPVLITRAQDDEDRPLGPFQKILVGIDHSLFSGPIARLATTVAAPGAMVELMHVWAPPYVSTLNTHLGGIETTEWINAVENARAAEAERLSILRDELAIAGASCFVGAGNVPTALLDRAEELNADLIVLGAHGRRDLRERLLGTTSDRLLRHAGIAVLLMPEESVGRWVGVGVPAASAPGPSAPVPSTPGPSAPGPRAPQPRAAGGL
jgi:nucleotide-binding universal stress UspA family protein